MKLRKALRYQPDRVVTAGGESRHLHTTGVPGRPRLRDQRGERKRMPPLLSSFLWRLKGRNATAMYVEDPNKVQGYYKRTLLKLIKMIRAIRRDITDQDILEAMVTGNVETVMRKIEQQVVATMPSLLATVHTDAVRDMFEWGKQLKLVDDVGVAMDIINTRTAYRNEQNAMELVRPFLNEQRQILNQQAGLQTIKDRILETGQPTEFIGQNPRELAARTFDAGKAKKRIGLTEWQYRAVDNVDAMLRRGDYDDLTFNRPLFTEDLQDKVKPYRVRDPATGAYKRMPNRVVDQIVGQYTDNKIVHRLETIARTEMLRNVNEGKNDAWRLMIDTGETERSWWKPTWDSSQDNRVRDSHKAPLHGQVMGSIVPEAFVTNEGNVCQYPTDRVLPPEDSINCRCQILYHLEVPVDDLFANHPDIEDAFPL